MIWEDAITFINNFIWLKLSLNLWEITCISILILWSHLLLLRRLLLYLLLRDPLVQLGLQLLQWDLLLLVIWRNLLLGLRWLSIIIIYKLVNLVWRSCYRIRIYSVVNICYVLGLWRLRMLNWWTWLSLWCLRTDLKLWILLRLLKLLLWKLLGLRHILSMVWLLVLVLSKLFAHDLCWFWCSSLLLRSHKIILLWLRNTILCLVLNLLKTCINRLCRIDGINCVDNAIATGVSTLYGANVSRGITLRNTINLFLLLGSALSLAIKGVHNYAGLNLFVCIWVALSRWLLRMKDLVESLRSMSSVFCLRWLLRIFGFRWNLLFLYLNWRISIHAGI